MFIAYVVLAVVVALVLAMSARAKLTRDERVVTTMTGVGVPVGWFWWLASCEIAGAVGLLVGIFFAPLGIAAAIGLILYFVGAVSTHLRARDYKGITAPAPLLVGAVVVLVLRLAA